MPSQRVPGPVCVEGQEDGSFYVDEGTTNLQMCVSPDPLAPSGAELEKMICEAPFSLEGDDLQATSATPDNEVFVFDWKKVAQEISGKIKDFAPAVKDSIDDLAPALKKLGITGKAYIKTYKGKQYVILKGYAGLRKILTGTRYLASNVKVVDLVIGTGRMAKSAVKSSALSVILVTADNVLKHVLEDKDLLSREFGFRMATDLTKSAVSAIIALAGGAALTALAAPVAVTIAGGIIIGLAVGLALDAAFPTDDIVAAMEAEYQSIVRKMSRGLDQLEREIIWRFAPEAYHYLYR